MNTNNEIILDNELKKKKDAPYFTTHFAILEKQKINTPQDYFPKKEFLEFHLDTIFNKQTIY